MYVKKTTLKMSYQLYTLYRFPVKLQILIPKVNRQSSIFSPCFVLKIGIRFLDWTAAYV